jgi:hypothetical protein
MRDPQTARRATVVTKAPDTIASAADAVTPAAQLYERNVYAVRLPDGKLMLVTQ